MLVALMFACTAGDATSDDTGSSQDTDESSDSGETADSGDSGDSGNPDTGLAEVLALGFDVGGAWEGTTLSLTWLDVRSFGTGSLAFGDVLLSVPAEERVVLDPVDPPDARFLQELDPVAFPGVKVAYFAPSLHLDTDGDGLPSAEEGYLGASLTFALYVTGVRGFVATLPDVVNGWNAVQIPFAANTEIALVDPLSIPIDATLATDDTFDLAGTGSGRAALVSSLARAGTTVDTPTVWDGKLAAPWTIHVDGPPPADHYQYLDRLGVDGAVEVAVGYADTDASGGWTSGDGDEVPLCLGDDAVGLVYVPRVTNLPVALGLTYAGVSAGWIGSRVNETGSPPPGDEEMTMLVLDGGCSL